MTDKLYLLQITMLAKQAGAKKLQFNLVLALPSSEAPQVYLTWRCCLACWDSTADESTHAGETGHKSHPIPSLHATAPSSGSEGAGKALARRKASQRTQSCSDTEQACSPHLREHHLGGQGTHSTTAATRARVKSRKPDL